MNIITIPLEKTKAKSLEKADLGSLKLRETEIYMADIVAVTDRGRVAILKNRYGEHGIFHVAEFRRMTGHGTEKN